MLFQPTLCAALGLAALIVQGGEARPETTVPHATGSLDDFLAAQSPIAFQGILNNIGPSGAYSEGVNPGVVIASPSKQDPDYFYTWVRDAALTVQYLVEELVAGNASLQFLIQDYISSQARLQTVENPSGSLSSGGLGEPKFHVDETAFTDSWGRPQRDGPPLRAIAMISFANYLIDNGHQSTVEDIIWPIVRNDLSYVSQHWNETTFDIWEEVHSSSFFTTAVQYRALVQGSALASKLGHTCDNCGSQAPQILCFLQSYWTGSHILANTGGGRSGKDVSTILGVIGSFDPNADCDDVTFQPCSARALANHKQVVDSFRSIYAINAGIPSGSAVAVGRYPEDVYQGGHPWYLTTAAAAEQLYDAIYQWNHVGHIDINAVNLDFFKSIYPSAAEGTYTSDSSTFQDIISAVRTYADGFLSVIEKYTPPDNLLAEQFHRETGIPLSAASLTWSYAALNTAAQRRASIVPSPWNSNSTDLPDKCSATSATGPYATPTNTAWPTTTQPPERPACTPPSEVTLTFNALVDTAFGQNIYLVGSIPELGSWDPANALLMSAKSWTSGNPVWTLSISLPAGTSFEYKFIRKDDGSSDVVWESDPNRSYNVPKDCGANTATVNSWWR
ncbi:hypothetical protein VTN49DRAFT_7908 [Thermomyces lanuginosus]|uniref:Glucoamylase n=1 Tax=Thermomyces lanuginosus TaxID=5541 RepID=Q58HN1_THELA|nr:glucoamylase precursor [Thermomyces lanuginosus]